MNEQETKKQMFFEEVLMAKAAWYYYHEEMTQQQVSERLGLSRMKVIRLLDQAKRTGIIQFRFRQDSTWRLELEQQLIRTYGLTDCFIVPAPALPEECNENVAKAAAMYIGSHTEGEAFINIGYGDTASRVLNHLAIHAERPLSCVSLTGGVSPYLPNARSSVFNCRLYLIPTPLLVSSEAVADAMRAEKATQDIQALIPLSSLSVIGIGALHEGATVLKTGVLTKNDFLLLERNGAVGDILSHFINENGEPVSTDLERRTISTELDTIKKLKNVIGVAAGVSKVRAIRAVLRGRYLTALVTDESTAMALVAGDE